MGGLGAQAGRAGGTYRHDAVPGHERPAPLPPGPGERYANVAAPVGLAAYALTSVGTFHQDRALSLLIAGTPRGPRYGGRRSPARWAGPFPAGALVLRPEALRRLDRIDTVVLDARLLADHDWTIEGVLRLPPPGSRPGGARPTADGPTDGGPDDDSPADGDGPDDDEIHVRIHELIEPDGPAGRRRRHGAGS
ncbi:hypothetical protein ACR6C2_13115 [Streptomyces sp. INA 01156]